MKKKAIYRFWNFFQPITIFIGLQIADLDFFVLTNSGDITR